MDRIELLYHRRQTAAVLREDGRQVTLLRPSQSESAGGGKKPGPPTPQAPQRGALVPASRMLPTLAPNDSDATLVQQLAWMLVMAWDANVQKKDRFELDDETYEVTSILSDRRYQTLVGVEQR